MGGYRSKRYSGIFRSTTERLLGVPLSHSRDTSLSLCDELPLRRCEAHSATLLLQRLGCSDELLGFDCTSVLPISRFCSYRAGCNRTVISFSPNERTIPSIGIMKSLIYTVVATLVHHILVLVPMNGYLLVVVVPASDLVLYE